MSLINDALNKAARDRAEDAVLSAPLTARERAARRRESFRAQSFGLILLNAAALAALFAIVVIVVLRHRTGETAVPGGSTPALAARPSRSSPPATESSATPASSAAETTSIAAAEPAAPPADPPPPDYEFTGMTAVGRDTFLSIARRSDQRSFWIPVGRSVAGITAVSYDERRDLAVIRVGTELVSLPLRNTAGTPASPAE